MADIVGIGFAVHTDNVGKGAKEQKKKNEGMYVYMYVCGVYVCMYVCMYAISYRYYCRWIFS